MAWMDLLLKRKPKKRQAVRQKQVQKKKPKKKDKPAGAQKIVVQEDASMTMMKEILGIRYAIDDLKRGMHDDHHRILDEFSAIPKHDDLHNALGEKLDILRKEQERIAQEIEITELQKKILDAVIEPMSAAEVANVIGKSRTWVSQQVGTLLKAGYLEKTQEGKSIKYKTTAAGTEKSVM